MVNIFELARADLTPKIVPVVHRRLLTAAGKKERGVRFKLTEQTRTPGGKLQILVSSGDRKYRIYRTLTKVDEPSDIWMSRRAEQGEKVIWPRFIAMDHAFITGLVIVNDIKSLLSFLPENTPPGVVKHMLVVLAATYGGVTANESRPHCEGKSVV